MFFQVGPGSSSRTVIATSCAIKVVTGEFLVRTMG